jgi:hypothetical protein
MPMLIDYIDKIARREQRGVLFICFFPPERIEQSDETFDWEHSENRKDVIRWLDEKQIKWTPFRTYAKAIATAGFLSS